MIILITGATHTGKTNLAQQLLEQYDYPYLSLDQLKMGLIRSGQTDLTPESSIDQLTNYLWPIVSEMIKTAIENGQHLIVEGAYIPFDWQEAFDKSSLSQIKYLCLVMSDDYIESNFDQIKSYQDVIENRQQADVIKAELIDENNYFLNGVKKAGHHHILIDDKYELNQFI